MRIIKIDLETEPICLKEIRYRGDKFENLQGVCKTEIQNLLRTQQQGYCAYCEQKFKSTVFIEHYISQYEDSSQELVFGNLLGVCSGKFYLDKKGKGKHIEHCDTSRKSTKLTINPKLQDHIDGVYYESDATIRSANTVHDEDLRRTLNLNFQQLKDMRDSEFKSNLDNLTVTARLQKLTKQEAYIRALRFSISGSTQFAGYISYRYKKLIEEATE